MPRTATPLGFSRFFCTGGLTLQATQMVASFAASVMLAGPCAAKTPAPSSKGRAAESARRRLSAGAASILYAPYQRPYVWRKGDILSMVLARYGLGKSRGPMQIYGRRGWARRNIEANPSVKDWDHLPDGYVIQLMLPAVIQRDEAGSFIPSAQIASEMTPRQESKSSGKSVRPEPSGSSQLGAVAGEADGDDGEAQPPSAANVPPPSSGQVVPPDAAGLHLSSLSPKAGEDGEDGGLGLTLDDVWPAILAAGAGLGLAAALPRLRKARQARRQRLDYQRALYRSAQTYVRTFGRLTLTPLNLLDPAEDYERCLQVALLEATLSARAADRSPLVDYYARLGFFAADEQALSTLALTPTAPEGEESAFPPAAPAGGDLVRFLTMLKGQKPGVHQALMRMSRPA